MPLKCSQTCYQPYMPPSQDSNFWLEQSSFHQIKLQDKIASRLPPFPSGTRNCLWERRRHPGEKSIPTVPENNVCTQGWRVHTPLEADGKPNSSHLWLVIGTSFQKGVGAGETAPWLGGLAVLSELGLILSTTQCLQQSTAPIAGNPAHLLPSSGTADSAEHRPMSRHIPFLKMKQRRSVLVHWNGFFLDLVNKSCP